VRRSLARSTAALSSLETRVRVDLDDLQTRVAQSHQLQAEVSRLEGIVADLKSTSAAVANFKPQLVRVASFLLSAPIRGMEPPQVLTVSSDVEQLSVTLKLDEAEFNRYRVRLKSHPGETALWQSSTLAPEASRHGAALRINLAAKLVNKGAYSFDVVGLDHGREVAVERYVFNVARED
jgi:hypothetical protein